MSHASRSLAARAASFLIVGLAWFLVPAPPLCAQGSFSHRWSGFVHDAFTLDGEVVWTVEDGGRIRHRNAAGTWSFHNVPDSVKDTLRRIFFLPNGTTGWAVGQDGKMLTTLNGGNTWNLHSTPPPAPLSPPGGIPLDLWAVHFIDSQTGWVLSTHRIWITTDAGASWSEANILQSDGVTPFPGHYLDSVVEFYAVDIVTDAGGNFVVGLATAEPGYVFRSTNGTDWILVLDVKAQLCPLTRDQCLSIICSTPPPPILPAVFEPWDVAISRHPTQPLALVEGGVGTNCGSAFRSTDGGQTWTREYHECDCPASGGPGCISCGTDPLYNPQPAPTTWRHQVFRTLYGVAIDSNTNVAYAGGYAGQHLRRDPATGVWQDQSSFGELTTHSSAVTMPLNGAVSAGPNGNRLLVGYGGFIRSWNSSTQLWQNEVTNVGPWRVRDVYSPGGATVWVVGQLQRIARSTNGGLAWTQATPPPSQGTLNLNAITFAPGVLVGVAVGDKETRVGFPDFDLPKILYATQGGLPQTETWATPTIIPHPSGSVTGKSLREVDWAGTQDDLEVFWSTGEKGLILASFDSGANWQQFMPAGVDPVWFQQLEFEGVAFQDLSTGILVGRDPPTNSGVAYQYRDTGAGPTWTSLMPASHSITKVSDVDVSGNVAYAVGVQDTPSGAVGVILQSSAGTGGFGAFTVLAQTVPPCTVGAGIDVVPILNEVEIVPGSGPVWVAGQCGRVWRYTTSGGGLLVEFKSQTDAHVFGMTFPSSGIGYMACNRVDGSQSCIVGFNQ